MLIFIEMFRVEMKMKIVCSVSMDMQRGIHTWIINTHFNYLFLFSSHFRPHADMKSSLLRRSNKYIEKCYQVNTIGQRMAIKWEEP